MKLSLAILALCASTSAAFAPSVSQRTSVSLRESLDPTESMSEVEGAVKDAAPKVSDPFDSPRDLAGVVAPTGFFDPAGFAARADAGTMKRYREAEVTHGRVGMMAVVGFLAGEAVEGSSFLFDSQVSGPAITHLNQIPSIFWILLTVGIGASEVTRAQIGWVEPENVPPGKPGLLRDDYVPGDIGFDPLGLKPSDAQALKSIQTKELQNGRLAMLAAAGCMAQELANGKGILENLGL
jgi:hypothetical protein